MRRLLVIVLAVMLVASYSTVSYAGKGTCDQTKDQVQAQDGTGANCPNPDCPSADCPNPDCPNPDCDGTPDQDRARDGTGNNAG